MSIQEKFQNSTEKFEIGKRLKELIKNTVGIMDFKSKLIEEYFVDVSFQHYKINLKNSIKLLLVFLFHSVAFNVLVSSNLIQILLGLLCVWFTLICYLLTIFIKKYHYMKLLTLVIMLVLTINNIFSLYESYNLPEINFTPTLQMGLLMFASLPMKLHVAVSIWVISYALLLMTIITNLQYKLNADNLTSYLSSVSVVTSLWKLPIFDRKIDVSREFLALSILGLGLTGICLYLFFVNNIHRRSAFLRIGHNIQIKQQLRAVIKSQMRWVDAIMPEVIKTEYVIHNEEIKNGKWVFVKNFENVSILFADIVGFTNICSSKSALEVVTLLNDLFNRFDGLCQFTNCEKLGTLGDCYYCVSGCPISRPDHAVSCIEMGLGMCRIIKNFNNDHNENVDMRVGVHTGRVNAAVLGKIRFRFDVYSNDVLIASNIESSGKPGFVHISQMVYSLVMLLYKVESGEDLEIKMEKEQGIAGTSLESTLIKTYFIDPKSPYMKRGEQIVKRENFRIYSTPGHKSTGSFDSIDITGTESTDNKKWNRKMTLKLFKDKTFIENLKFDPTYQVQFLNYPPINVLTMMFVDREIEWNFNTHSVNELNTFSIDSLRLTSLLDCVTCLMYSSTIYLALFIIFPDFTWKTLGVVATNIFLSLLISVFYLWESYYFSHISDHDYENLFHSIVSHPFIKALICFYYLSTPLFIVFILNDCKKIYVDYSFTTRYFTLILFSLFITTLFLSAHYLVKMSVCFLIIISVTLVLLQKPCIKLDPNTTFPFYSCLRHIHKDNFNYYGKVQCNFLFQIIMTFLLLFLIIRELELNIRLLFYVSREVGINSEEATDAKNNAQDLLYNIIPKFVFNHLRTQTENQSDLTNLSYAVSIPLAAVVFACISNFFSKYYREDYKGGENALKLLHQIICNFDDLLKKDFYKDVEKIKTINDCYMVASGLNSKIDRNFRTTHLFTLMHYAFDLKKCLDRFNDNYIIGTDKFLIKIGYNFGPVTAGIIGATKPMYDIWGDTVNVSSRMYSTGTPGMIQVPEHVIKVLESEFVFEYRGIVNIKGKGNMKTYLCVGLLFEYNTESDTVKDKRATYGRMMNLKPSVYPPDRHNQRISKIVHENLSRFDPIKKSPGMRYRTPKISFHHD